MNDTDAILATFEEYAEAYCAKDIDRLMRLFDAGDDITAIGTGADELCASRAAVRSLFERNFAEATANRFEWHWRQVQKVADVASVAATLTIYLDLDGEAVQVPIRWTVIMTRRPEGWRWLHRHASSAADGQEEGAAYPTQQPS